MRSNFALGAQVGVLSYELGVSYFVVFIALVSNGALCAFGCWKVFLPPA
jgi:hypothetical protein